MVQFFVNLNVVVLLSLSVFYRIVPTLKKKKKKIGGKLGAWVQYCDIGGKGQSMCDHRQQRQCSLNKGDEPLSITGIIMTI